MGQYFIFFSLLFALVIASSTPPIGNRIVEEGERQKITLYKHFTGNLLQYKLNIYNTTDYVRKEVTQMIYVEEPLANLSMQYLTNASFQKYRAEPFPESSLITEELYQARSKQALYFITRDMHFMGYNMSTYMDDGQLQKLYDRLINSSYVGNADCRNLLYQRDQRPFDNQFMFFCKFNKLEDDKGIVEYMSVVYINKNYLDIDQNHPLAVLQFVMPTSRMKSLHLDFDSGFRIFRLNKDLNRNENLRGQVFLSTSKISLDPNAAKLQLIGLNLTIFKEMTSNNINYQEARTGHLILYTQQDIFLTNAPNIGYIPNEILLLKNDNSSDFAFFALNVPNYGVVICKVNGTKIGSIYSSINCNYEESQLLPLLRYRIVQMYLPPKETLDKKEENQNFYAICTQPPSILEFDISNLDNVLISKIYQVNEMGDRYIGRVKIAVNNNYILHLLENPDTGDQVVRVFCRNSLLHSSAKFDIRIPRESRAGYFIFPYQYFNFLIFRDERTVNVTAIVEWSLNLDARNSTLVSLYKNQNIQVVVLTENNAVVLGDMLIVNFVDKYNTSIVALDPKVYTNDIKIFYNCGENKFNYILSDFLNGPNYNIYQINDTKNGYFKLENQGIKEYYRNDEIDFKEKCNINFWFTYAKYFDPKAPKDSNNSDQYLPTILVCIEKQNTSISSYIMRQRLGSSTLQKTNEISMPGLKLIDFTYDNEERIIFALAESPEYANKKELNLKAARYEIHIFKVQNEAIWIKMIKFNRGNNITFISYNQQLKEMLFVEYRNLSNAKGLEYEVEILRSIPFNLSSSNLTSGKVGSNLNITWDQRTIKAVQASQRAIISMTLDKRLCVYQISGIRINLIKEYEFEGLINFDVFDGEYLVLYSGKNKIEIYEIEMYLHISYRMVLPYYKTYENFQFRFTSMFTDYKMIARTYNEKFLGFLVTDNIQTLIMVYGLNENQHNAMVFAIDVTEQFGTDQTQDDYVRIFLTGSLTEKTILITASNKQVHIYDAHYLNKLILNEEMLPNLISDCKNLIPPYQYSDKRVMIDDWSVEVENIMVMADSLFPPEDNKIQDEEHTFKISILTANQGSAVASKQNQDQKIRILYQNDTISTGQPYRLLYETYMQGQNLKYKTRCHYFVQNGSQVNCDNALTEEVKDVPYYFPIEFVTSQRKILKSFTLGQLFFMLDDQGQLFIQRLPLYSQFLDSVDGQALITIFQASQESIFGCFANGYIEYFNITEYFNYTKYPKMPVGTYMMVYQCRYNNITERQALNFLQVTVYPIPQRQSPEDDEMPFKFLKYNETLQIPYEIIDIEILSEKSGKTDLVVLFCITEKIPFTYSGLFTVYQLIMNGDFLKLNMHQVDVLSANSLDLDTFYPTKMLQIPETGLMITVIENYGAYIINVTSIDKNRGPNGEMPRQYDIVIGEIDFMKNNTFAVQLEKEKGPIKVYTLMVNWPNSIHFMTNYGLFIVDYAIDLNSTEQILASKKSLIPKSIRLIRMDFDYFNGEVAQNAYGSAFLLKKNYEADNYQVSLAAISYFSTPNSQFFKLLNVTWNEDCFALNQNSYFELSPEDQIAVSFICNDYLQIFRVCMRPHVVVDLFQFQDNSTHMDKDTHTLEHGVYSYNKFYIEIEGLQKDFNNSEIVKIEINFEQQVLRETSVKIGFALIGLIIFLFLIFWGWQSNVKQPTQEKMSPFQNRRTTTESYIPTDYSTKSFIRTPYMNINGTIVDTFITTEPQGVEERPKSNKIQNDESMISEEIPYSQRTQSGAERDWVHRTTSRFGRPTQSDSQL